MRCCEPEVQTDRSRPIARPPIVFASSILAGLAFERIWALGLPVPGALGSAGALLVALAVVLFGRSAKEFRRFRTPIPSTRPSSTVVRTGPYRFSRNPIYVAFALLQLGVGLWVGSGWVLAMLVPALVLISYGVIDREEKYLARKFGQAYLDYRRSVRRWF